jgi:uncharacterized protein YxjI
MRDDERREQQVDESETLQLPAGGEGAAKRYQMTQHMDVIGGDFWIEDEQGKSLFKVHVNAQHAFKTLIFSDAQDRMLCQIHGHVLAVEDSLEIEAPNGEPYGMVRNVLISPVRERWTIQRRDETDLEIKGNILDHEYRIEQAQSRVAAISKQWFGVGNSYGVEVGPGQEDILILAATVAIDMMAHAHQ